MPVCGNDTGQDGAFLARILALLGLAFLITASVSTARMALTASLGARLLADARLRLFEHIQRLPPRWSATVIGSSHSGARRTSLRSI